MEKNPPKFFQWQGRTFAIPPRAPPESQLQNERMLEPHYSVGIPGGCGGNAIVRPCRWESLGFFFSHLTSRQWGLQTPFFCCGAALQLATQVQILGDLFRGSARGAKRPTFDLGPNFRRRGFCFRRRFFVLHTSGPASRDLVIWGGGPPVSLNSAEPGNSPSHEILATSNVISFFLRMAGGGQSQIRRGA